MKFLDNKRIILVAQIACLILINGLFIYWHGIGEDYLTPIQIAEAATGNTPVGSPMPAYAMSGEGSPGILAPEMWHPKLAVSIVDNLDSYH